MRRLVAIALAVAACSGSSTPRPAAPTRSPVTVWDTPSRNPFYCFSWYESSGTYSQCETTSAACAAAAAGTQCYPRNAVYCLGDGAARDCYPSQTDCDHIGAGTCYGLDGDGKEYRGEDYRAFVDDEHEVLAAVQTPIEDHGPAAPATEAAWKYSCVDFEQDGELRNVCYPNMDCDDATSVLRSMGGTVDVRGCTHLYYTWCFTENHTGATKFLCSSTYDECDRWGRASDMTFPGSRVADCQSSDPLDWRVSY